LYFGSVKFFKHLIYGVFILIVTAILFSLIFFTAGYFKHKEAEAALRDELLQMEANQASFVENTVSIPENATLGDVYLHLLARGFTPQNMLNYISEAHKDDFSAFVESQSEGDAPEGEEVQKNPPVDTTESYTKLYPDLYAEPPQSFVISPNTAYLTFDDGPSEYTADLLTILDKYQIKATFFFSGGTSDSDKAMMKRIADEGHTIGVHSISHNYTEVYESIESFLEDFYNTYQNIYEATGVRPSIFRFPGGSINNYNRLYYEQIIAEMTRRGFVYYDWNVAGDDASNTATWTSIYNSVTRGAKEHIGSRIIVLLHDSKAKTITVVEDVIVALRDMGFTFSEIKPDTMPSTFSYDDIP
jgi:peptidoglycan/xylan/chitin deacetylase (PgdA/CDA1 family)